jgi:aminomethyltransferase
MPEQKTVLHGLHAELGARFCPFAGFEMPLQYPEGLRAEHLYTRAHAGLFDVSHMGQVRVTGPDLHETLERALPVDFDAWPLGAQRYSLLLNERGGIEDDLMVTRLPDEVRIVVNAAGREKDLALLRALCPRLSFELLDRALIALQGPEAEAVFAPIEPGVVRLKFMQAAVLGERVVSRSGYTGEDGFEISIANEQAAPLARTLLSSSKVKPVGLGARDTLRLEAGLHLYGQDMDANTTAVEASLGWAIAPSRRRQQGGWLSGLRGLFAPGARGSDASTCRPDRGRTHPDPAWSNACRFREPRSRRRDERHGVAFDPARHHARLRDLHFRRFFCGRARSTPAGAPHQAALRAEALQEIKYWLETGNTSGEMLSVVLPDLAAVTPFDANYGEHDEPLPPYADRSAGCRQSRCRTDQRRRARSRGGRGCDTFRGHKACGSSA